MRKPLAVLAIVALSFALAACGETPAHVTASHTPKPTPSASPSPTPAPKQAEPARTAPLDPLIDPDILEYCPDIPAVHFDRDIKEVDQANICSSEPAGDGTKESANWVNFGLDALLSAYSQPNELATGGDCSTSEMDPLIVWLTDKKGKVFTVYAPVDRCGLPTAAAANAYQSAGLQVLYEADLDADGKPIETQ